MHDLSLYLLEILENSIRADARRVDTELMIDLGTDTLRLVVDDDGSGLSATPEQTLDPFYTTKPGKKTGLGLSLLKAEAEASGGTLRIGPSPVLRGTRVEVDMRLQHVDRPPLGDVAATMAVTALTNPDITFTMSLRGDRFHPPLDYGSPAEAARLLARFTEQPPAQGAARRTQRG